MSCPRDIPMDRTRPFNMARASVGNGKDSRALSGHLDGLLPSVGLVPTNALVESEREAIRKRR